MEYYPKYNIFQNITGIGTFNEFFGINITGH